MFDGRFVGFADFLVLDGDALPAADTKLARSVKVEALLQLAAYADTLAARGRACRRRGRAGARRRRRSPATASTSCCRCTGRRRAACSGCSTTTSPAARRSPGRTTSVRACFRCPECTIQVRATRRPAAGRRHAGHPARPADRRGHHHHHGLAAPRRRVDELSARTVTALTAQARLQVATARRRQAALRDRRRAAADGAARAEQGRPVLRLRGRPAVDGRRPRVGPGIPVGRARHRRRVPPLWAHDRASERKRCVDFLEDGAQAAQAISRTCTSTTTPPTRRRALLRLAGRYGVGEDEVDDLLRNGVLVDLYPVGAQEHSGRHRELQPEVARAAVHGRANCAPATSPRPPTRSPQYAQLLRAARRRPRRRCGGRAQGDRGLQPLRLPVDAQAARLADCAGHRVRGAARRRRSRSRDGGDDRADRRPRAHAAQVRRRRHRAARTPEQTAVGDGLGGAGLSPARGQAVLVGAFRPPQQSRRRMGRQQPTCSSPSSAEVVADWHSRPRRASRSGGCGSPASSRPANSTSEMYALYDPPAPAGLTDDPDRRACGSVTVVELRRPGATDRGRSSSSGTRRTAACSTSCRSP